MRQHDPVRIRNQVALAGSSSEERIS